MNAIRVLLITEDATVAEAVQQVLSTEPAAFRLHTVRDIAIAKARLDGGGIDAVLAGLSQPRWRDTLVLAAKRVVPLILLCDSEAKRREEAVGDPGLAIYLPQPRWRELPKEIRLAVGRARAALGQPGKVRRLANNRVAVMGAKGGSGTTTVAMNLAWCLAQTRDTALVELRSGFGTLRSHFRPQKSVGSISRLVTFDPAAIAIGHVPCSSWACPHAPGLMILSPSSEADCCELTSAHVDAILTLLARHRDYVVVDLPPFLSPVTREALHHSDTLVLLLERDHVSVEAGRALLRAVAHSDWRPASIETVVVNRTAVACPMPLADVEDRLGTPVAAVIPPDADLCLTAQSARTAVVALRPESLMAQAIVNLARGIFGSAFTDTPAVDALELALA